MPETPDSSVSWLVVGTIHLPQFVKIDLKDSLRRIEKEHITKTEGEYVYTICRVTDVGENGVAGILAKYAKTASEEVFNTVIWAPVEVVFNEKMITVSRFLISGHLIVLEEKKPQLSRTNFASRLEDLLSEVVKVEHSAVFQLAIYFHKNPDPIQRFIEQHQVINKVTLSNIKIMNPLPEGVARAREMIDDLRMKDCQIENPEGINKQGELFNGFVTLSEESQLDMEIQAPKIGRGGRVSIDSFFTRLRLFRKKVKIKKDLGSFIHEASQVLRDHLRRYVRK